MSEFMKNFISVAENNPSHVFDFITQRWHEASREEQRRIVLELVYAISRQGSCAESEIMLKAAGELSEMYWEED